MKRHVSIFAFLLGVFAATAQAADKQLVNGGYYFVENGPYGNLDLNRMQHEKGEGGLNLKFAELEEGHKATFVAYPEKGMEVAQWGKLLKSKSTKATTYDNTYTWVNAKPDETTCEWTGKPADGDGYIAVNFKYVPFGITFDGNGGTGEMKPITGLNIISNAIKLTSCAFTRTGYEMVGWSNAVYWAAHQTVIDNGATVRGEDFWDDAVTNFDGKLVVLWEPNRHLVTCDLGKGTWPTAGYEPPEEVACDQVFSLPAPTRAGYGFIGWKVTSGLDSSTAKWGKDDDPSTQIGRDTLCINGDKEVYFKNLNPTNGVSVTLTAQWQAKSITVTFNNNGGSSGGGVLDTLPVIYDDAYVAVNAPTKGGSLFRGYEIGGVVYWDGEGQPMKDKWDIPTNCTARAQWEELAYQLTYNENRSDGMVSKTVVRDFEYGKPTELYDGADFSNLGCTLLGWSTDPNALAPSYEPGGSATFTESKTLYAVWEKNYFIAYDGNGATNGTPMAVQKFVFGKENQSLNPNAYGKVGYSFLGWATNRVAAQRLDWAYKDRQILKDDLATTLGETNTLYATWGTNTYFIAFNSNGGTGTMANQPFVYDQPQRLCECTFKRGELWSFAGWTNSAAGGSFYTNREEVVNLCAEDGGTVTLDAVWHSELSELSIAMDCKNLIWTSEKVKEADAWVVCTERGFGGSCAELVPEAGKWVSMYANIGTNGTLTFKWQPSGESSKLLIQVKTDKGETSSKLMDGSVGDWTEGKYEIPQFLHGATSARIDIWLESGTGPCYVDQMTWIPEGANPEPTDADKVTISSAAVSDGRFTLSFKSDERFDYNLLTNANLLINSWGVMDTFVGDGSIHTFEPEIYDDQPQLFYKVKTIQKK